MSRFYGVIVPLVTPFRKDYSIDQEALRWLVRYLLRHGVHGLFPNSTTGEFVHLSFDEMVLLTEIVAEEAGGRAWVIPGISTNYTGHSIELAKRMSSYSIDGFIVTPPYYFRPSREALKRHFSLIAERVERPIILYNIPSTTGVEIPVDLVEELAREHSNIAGIKITSEDFSYLRRVVYRVKSIRRDFSVLTGLDELLLPLLMMGGDGGIMALANVFPWVHVEVFETWRRGDLEKAYKTWTTLLRLSVVYEILPSAPVAVKTLLKIAGAPIENVARPPLQPAPPGVEESVRKLLIELGLLREPGSRDSL